MKINPIDFVALPDPPAEPVSDPLVYEPVPEPVVPAPKPDGRKKNAGHANLDREGGGPMDKKRRADERKAKKRAEERLAAIDARPEFPDECRAARMRYVLEHPPAEGLMSHAEITLRSWLGKNEKQFIDETERLEAAAVSGPVESSAEKPAPDPTGETLRDLIDKLLLEARDGYTLLELLVTLTIVSVLVGVLLSAVQNVRELAVRVQCQNNLKQLALAASSHVSAHGRLPAGGSECWEVPGPFAQLKPFAEFSIPPVPVLEVKKAIWWEGTPPLLTCPKRGRGLHDYAWNGGSAPVGRNRPCEEWDAGPDAPLRPGTFRQAIDPSTLPAGTSNTILLGEKRVNRAKYGDETPQYNQSVFTSWDWDLVRWLNEPPQPDWSDSADGWWGRDLWTPRGRFFGGPHRGGWQAAYCDGHVEFRQFVVRPPVVLTPADPEDPIR